MDTPKITPEQFNVAMSYARLGSHTLKKIKVTYNFYQYLVAKCNEDVILEKDDFFYGSRGYFTGIPIEIDDTIENEYYELVYEENKND